MYNTPRYSTARNDGPTQTVIDTTSIIAQEEIYSTKRLNAPHAPGQNAFGEHNDLKVGGDGINTLSVTGDNNYLEGDDGSDILSAIGDGNRIYGAEGNDALYAEGNSNGLFGNGGDDVLEAIGEDNGIFGGEGNDAIDELYAKGDSNKLEGEAGDSCTAEGTTNIVECVAAPP